MSVQQSKELVRRLLDAHARNDLAAVREALSPDLAWHAGGAPSPLRRDDYLAGLTLGNAAFPGMKVVVEDLIAEGDRVAARLALTITHSGPFLDIPPTGRTLTFTSLWMYRIDGGRVAEAWHLDEDFVSKLRERG